MNNNTQNNVSANDAGAKKEDIPETEQMVPLSMLQGMMAEIEELKKGQADIKKSNTEKKDEDAPEEVEKDIMRLLEYKGKLVVSFNEDRGTWKKWDKERREDKIFMEVMLQDVDGKEIKKEVDYMDLMEEGKIVECEVLGIETKEDIKKGRMIPIRKVDGYKTVNTSSKVRQIVTNRNSMAKLKIPAPYNKEIEINTKFVNIR